MSTAIYFNSESQSYEFNGQCFHDANRTFSRKSRAYNKSEDGGKTLNVWRAEKRQGRRLLNDRGLGELIGYALGNGFTQVSFHSCTVTVNYLQKMLAFKAKHGWFLDYLFDNADHKFDGNVPTPGGHWGEGRKLLAEAAEMQPYANLCRAAYRTDEANETEQQIADLKARAKELLFKRS